MEGCSVAAARGLRPGWDAGRRAVHRRAGVVEPALHAARRLPGGRVERALQCMGVSGLDARPGGVRGLLLHQPRPLSRQVVGPVC